MELTSFNHKESRVMDFYYSLAMKNYFDNMDELGRKRLKRHKVLINGELKDFTLQVPTGMPHGCKWKDLIFIGTAEDKNIQYMLI